MSRFESVSILCRIAWIAVLWGASAASAGAQTSPSARFLDVGSERERVLRVLQLTGDVPLYPWSIRAFSPAEWDRLTPKTERGLTLMPPESRARSVGAMRVEILPVEGGVVYNSAFPYGFNDGALWAGRGLTGSVTGGVAVRVGPLSFQLEPMLFDAQNSSFALRPTGVVGNPFLDGFYPGAIDLPQRFGDRAYARLDPGQSSVRLDLGPVAAELSSADQWWGPAIESPLILGNNAAGFPHLSLGTSRPISIWIGEIHGRVVYGRLEQSRYSSVVGADSVRFMSGAVGVFIPRGIPGLEIGATRFFHTQWPTNGLSHAPFGLPFEGILKQQLATANNATGDSPDNQLASVFARWAFPAAGIELYGEYGREDHNADARDFWQELDHDAGYSLGVQRAWKRRETGLLVIRLEVLNTRFSHLDQGRLQSPWYVHYSTSAQGHTNDGQLLGAVGGYGGGAATVAFDLYAPANRWTFSWSRIARGESAFDIVGRDPMQADVMHALTVERSRDIDRLSLFSSVSAVWDLNRNFLRDQFNLGLRVGARSPF